MLVSGFVFVAVAATTNFFDYMAHGSVVYAYIAALIAIPVFLFNALRFIYLIAIDESD